MSVSLFACIFHTAHEGSIWNHFSKGLNFVAMHYYCFIPSETVLLIHKIRAFDFIECDCVLISIYTLLWGAWCCAHCRDYKVPALGCLKNRQHNELHWLRKVTVGWKRKGNNRKQKKGNLFHERLIIYKAWPSGNLIPFGFYFGFVFHFILLGLMIRHGWDSA